MAMDMDVVYNQYGQRSPDERREVRPPLDVETATWATAGSLDYWYASAASGGDGYADPMGVRCGSRPAISGAVQIPEHDQQAAAEQSVTRVGLG